MKKLILAISLFAITAGTAFAGNENTIANMTPEQRVDYAIKSQISVPRSLTEVPGVYTAEVHFQVNAKGGIEINDIITDNEDLRHSLMYQAKSMSVNTAGLDIGNSYKITVKFNVVESN
jgi:hypothetical protein